MSPTPCPADPELLSLAAGTPIEAGLQAHLDACPRCRARRDQLRAEVASLRRAAGEPPTAVVAASALTEDWTPSLHDRPTATGDPEAGPEPPRPAFIGKYPVVGVLGNGGQATVYRAVHPTLGLDLAIKLAHRPAGDGQGELLRAEGRLLAGLDHPNLVRVYDLDLFEDRPFLAMQFVRGVALADHPDGSRPDPRQAAALVAAVARAASAAHRLGIVHQDIKPRNILVDEAGRPRLIDFGMARLRDAWSGAVAGPEGGTLAYTSPEQALGDRKRIGPASDVFALGGVLYFLLTRHAPFEGRNRLAQQERACRCDFDRDALRAASVPRRLEQICLRALAADPAGRHARADDLAAELEHFARKRTWPIVAALATLAAMVLLAFLGWYAWPEHRTPTPPDRPTTIPRPSPTPEPPATLDGPPSAADVRPRIEVQRAGQVLDLEDALPLQDDDRLAIRAPLPRGLRPSFFYMDSEGKVTDLTDQARVEHLDDGDRLVFPANPGEVVPLLGPPGTECFLICAGGPDPPPVAAIEAAAGPGRPWPSLPERAALFLDRAHVEVRHPSDVRGLGQAEAGLLAGASDAADRLRRSLRGRVAFLSGVAFPHIQGPGAGAGRPRPADGANP